MLHAVEVGVIAQSVGPGGVVEHALFYFAIGLEDGGDAEVGVKGTCAHEIKVGDVFAGLAAGLTAGGDGRLAVVSAAEQDQLDVFVSAEDGDQGHIVGDESESGVGRQMFRDSAYRGPAVHEDRLPVFDQLLGL